MGEHVFAGPTQILSDSTGSSNPHDVLLSLEAALQGKLPGHGEALEVPKTAFAFKEYRRATKNMLCGLVNAIQNVVPDFKMSQTIPPNPLRPASVEWDRVEFLTPELELHRPGFPGRAFFRHHPESGQAVKDYYDNDSFFRICLSADQGTEVGCLATTVEHANPLLS